MLITGMWFYLPPWFSPKGIVWLFIATATILKTRKESEKWTQKKKTFTCSQHTSKCCHGRWQYPWETARNAHLGAQLQSPRSSVSGVEPKKAVFYPAATLQMFWETKQKALLADFKNSRHCLEEEWESGVHGRGDFIIFLVLLTFFHENVLLFQ